MRGKPWSVYTTMECYQMELQAAHWSQRSERGKVRRRLAPGLMINTSKLFERLCDIVSEKYRAYLKHVLDKGGVELLLGTGQHQWM